MTSLEPAGGEMFPLKKKKKKLQVRKYKFSSYGGKAAGLAKSIPSLESQNLYQSFSFLGNLVRVRLLLQTVRTL